MPPRRPVSPLSLETCSPPTSDLDADGIIGSDDELTEEERAAQRRRIEKLAESYLQGRPLFILSASLRGPLDKGWVNPWKTNRKRNVPASRNIARSLNETEIPASPVIQETHSRKRRPHHEPPEVRNSRSHTIAPVSDFLVSGRNRGLAAEADNDTHLSGLSDKRDRRPGSPSTPRISIPWSKTINSNAQLHHSSSFRYTDENWLKKDRKQISFQNVDPPTSPTTTLSSRYSTKSRASKDAPVDSQTRSFEQDFSTSTENGERGIYSSPAHDGPAAESLGANRVSNSVTSSPAKDQSLSGLVMPETAAGAAAQDSAFCVLAPSSHLPEFEYRRRKPYVLNEKQSTESPVAVSLDVGKDQHLSSVAKGSERSEQQVSAPQDLRWAHPIRHGPVEADKDLKNFFTSTSTTNAVGNISVSHSAKFRSTSTVNKGNTSEKLPSAQQVRGNPTMTDITSLHSIAVPRGNSEDDGDTIPDPQFSTQAALLLAQRSFQNDLESQDDNIASSEIPQDSNSSNVSSPDSNNITPFHRLATPGIRAQAPATAGGQWLSTQCMIDAATPFTFSTEKKKSRRTISPVKHMTSRKKPKTTSFKLSPSPSSASSESHSQQSGHDSNRGPVPRQSPSHETQHSALPMTLTGTTPPTAQEGRQRFPDTDNFNLSQAIADAGSWLQQSFNLNKDLKQCGISNPGPSSSAGTRRSALGVDGNK